MNYKDTEMLINELGGIFKDNNKLFEIYQKPLMIKNIHFCT